MKRLEHPVVFFFPKRSLETTCAVLLVILATDRISFETEGNLTSLVTEVVYYMLKLCV